MKKYIVPGVVLCAVAIIGVLVWGGASEKAVDGMMPSGIDPANTTYLIEGEQVTLVGGVAEIAVADSSSTVRTAIFDQPVIGDLDNDGDKDMALVLQRQTGGSGLFYYLVVALQNQDATAQGTNALFLGDRIAPQGMSIQFGTITFNYADRKPGEPMTAQPSVGISLYAKIQNGELVKSESQK